MIFTWTGSTRVVSGGHCERFVVGNVVPDIFPRIWLTQSPSSGISTQSASVAVLEAALTHSSRVYVYLPVAPYPCPSCPTVVAQQAIKPSSKHSINQLLFLEKTCSQQENGIIATAKCCASQSGASFYASPSVEYATNIAFTPSTPHFPL